MRSRNKAGVILPCSCYISKIDLWSKIFEKPSLYINGQIPYFFIIVHLWVELYRRLVVFVLLGMQSFLENHRYRGKAIVHDCNRQLMHQSDTVTTPNQMTHLIHSMVKVCAPNCVVCQIFGVWRAVFLLQYLTIPSLSFIQLRIYTVDNTFPGMVNFPFLVINNSQGSTTARALGAWLDQCFEEYLRTKVMLLCISVSKKMLKVIIIQYCI